MPQPISAFWPARHSGLLSAEPTIARPVGLVRPEFSSRILLSLLSLSSGSRVSAPSSSSRDRAGHDSIVQPPPNPRIQGVPFQIDHAAILYKLKPHLSYPFYSDFGLFLP
jgi:hypothetical protein